MFIVMMKNNQEAYRLKDEEELRTWADDGSLTEGDKVYRISEEYTVRVVGRKEIITSDGLILIQGTPNEA